MVGCEPVQGSSQQFGGFGAKRMMRRIAAAAHPCFVQFNGVGRTRLPPTIVVMRQILRNAGEPTAQSSAPRFEAIDMSNRPLEGLRDQVFRQIGISYAIVEIAVKSRIVLFVDALPGLVVQLARALDQRNFIGGRCGFITFAKGGLKSE